MVEDVQNFREIYFAVDFSEKREEEVVITRKSRLPDISLVEAAVISELHSLNVLDLLFAWQPGHLSEISPNTIREDLRQGENMLSEGLASHSAIHLAAHISHGEMMVFFIFLRNITSEKTLRRGISSDRVAAAQARIL